MGGIIGIVTWLPRARAGIGPLPGWAMTIDRTLERPLDHQDIVNAQTPLLHINGLHDDVVTLSAGEATRDELSKVITDYKWKTFASGHLETPLRGMEAIRKWLKKKTPVEVVY